LGGVPLCERFGRLFDLAENKSSIVAEMFSSRWEADREAWMWQRQLWVWEEEMLGECQILLIPFTVQVGSPDRWQWHPDLDSGYSVVRICCWLSGFSYFGGDRWSCVARTWTWKNTRRGGGWIVF
jgi:hypothetical protein